MKKLFLFCLTVMLYASVSLTFQESDAQVIRTDYSCNDIDSPYCCLLGSGNCLPPVIINR
jgi:hypothetical protein